MAETVREIREGFLCPVCMKDLGTVTQLQSHFEEAHSSTEDKAVGHQIKELFDKAKRTLLGKKEDNYSSTQGLSSGAYGVATSSDGLRYNIDYWEPQETGQIRSRTDEFRALRGSRVDRYVVETNKLLIRMDKLIAPDSPPHSDSSKRKAFEKTVVMWMPDADLKHCPTCGRKFSITKRRHHCRLCGSIMCDRCSHFLTYEYARKLTDPAFQFDGDSGFLKRSGSSSSLNSMFSSEGDPHIRCCLECRKLLERREQLLDQRNKKPAIVLLYGKMKECTDECERLLETYLPMSESLSAGESTYRLQEAQIIRTKLLRQYDVIDQLSKKIVGLGVNAEEPQSMKQMAIQKSIRTFATGFIQDNMIGLQSLPSEEQYQKLQDARKAEIQKRIAMERAATIEAQEKEKRERDKVENRDSMQEKGLRQNNYDEQTERTNSQVHRGWKPAENSVRVTNEDPMLQQMEIIRSYIKQAKQANKWDEVKMLEENLRDLQREYASQQRQTWS
ncbi:hypothetical protein ACJMK2_015641 [Sinanodonta woodiana]|uniref:Rabenosyn-5 n=1 Tax=Sinanodonta woodiana TaxID=1069815 RepID=A0ABD3USH6_SINWO